MGEAGLGVGSLLERGGELDVIEGAIARALGGTGAAVLVQGVAGIGKSSLLAQAAAFAQAQGMEVLEARGAVLEREFPFGLARTLLEDDGAAATVAPPFPIAPDAAFAATYNLYRELVKRTAVRPVLARWRFSVMPPGSSTRLSSRGSRGIAPSSPPRS